jgi:hypothetical protein
MALSRRRGRQAWHGEHHGRPPIGPKRIDGQQGPAADLDESLDFHIKKIFIQNSSPLPERLN